MNRRQLFLSTAKAALLTTFGGSWLSGAAKAQNSAPQAPGAPSSHRRCRQSSTGSLGAADPGAEAVRHIDVLDARNAIPPPRFEVKAPPHAPNVLIDAGRRHGLRSVQRLRRADPYADGWSALANQGLRYNQFHTTALCSPTRTALSTGRNHHMNNMGGITEIATAFPGNTGARPTPSPRSPRCCASTATARPSSARITKRQRGRSARSGPDRSLADALRLRQVLWVHRRRDRPVGPS